MMGNFHLQVAPLSVQEEIFDHLQEFWLASTTPDQWQRVLLILIQKKADLPAMMGNFRPIGPEESLDQNGDSSHSSPPRDSSILQPNQFAFLPGRGTASELIQLINVLEEVAEDNFPVDLTTSDVRGPGGEFDSPERTAQWASWRRIGVSVPLATYLTNLGALFTYRLMSPYGMRQNIDPTLEGVDPITDNPWIPTRGGTQGDPLSTLGWVVFLDTLLTALNTVQHEFSFYIRLQLQLPACFAGDLHLVSPSREATIKANCIISAFAAMFGIEFAPAKLWATTTIDPPGDVVLYTREWIPIVVPFGDTKAFITSLDITYHLKRDTASIFLALCKKLRGIEGVLGGRQASIMARAMAQNLCTLPQIFYPLQFYCFSETQHDTLTTLLLKPLRVAKGVGTKLHSVVLTNPVLGGYINDVHLKVQEAKLWLFDWCIAKEGATRWAMECLCLRLFHRQDKNSSLMSSPSLIPVPQPFRLGPTGVASQLSPTSLGLPAPRSFE
jgi:hypothetical protein